LEKKRGMFLNKKSVVQLRVTKTTPKKRKKKKKTENKAVKHVTEINNIKN